jgi:hypothetical protein
MHSAAKRIKCWGVYDGKQDMIYLLTTIGLTPGGSSTVHIYTKQYTEQKKKAAHFRKWVAVPLRQPLDPSPQLKIICPTLKIHATVPSETSVIIYKAAGPHMLENFSQELLTL